jgi:hypothetical protein
MLKKLLSRKWNYEGRIAALSIQAKLTNFEN